MGELMSLQHELRLRAAHIDTDDLLQLLGYRRLTNKHRQRLLSVLNDPMLGFSRSAFDFRYDNRAFVLALADLLGVKRDFTKAALACIRQQLNAAEAFVVPDIKVDTGFKRTTHPLFALAVCEHQRTITLDESEQLAYQQLILADRVQWISAKVVAHYLAHQGQLGIWGTIQRYLCSLEPGKTLMMLPNGEVREERNEDKGVATVSLRHKSKPMTGLISG